MSINKKTKTEIVKNTLRRFGHLGDRTIARYLIAEYGMYFDYDIEKARTCVRYWTGKSGKQNRKRASTKEFFKETITNKMPKSQVIHPDNFKLPVGNYLILADIHVPFHEELPLKTAVEWGQAEKVDGIILNGDFGDNASIGYWVTPNRNFNKELEVQIDMLDWIRNQFKNKPIYYKLANHEARLKRKVLEKMPEMINTQASAIESYLDLDGRGIEYIQGKTKVMAGELPIFHGDEFRRLHLTVNPARGLFNKAHSFALMSHCHQSSEHTERDVNDNVITTWSTGCLCDLHPDYNPYGNRWNWGCAIVYTKKSGGFEVDNRRIMPSGKLK